MSRARFRLSLGTLTVVLGFLAVGCNRVMPELAEWKGRPVDEFIQAFSIGATIKITPVAAHYDFGDRTAYGMFLPAKGLDGKIHPTPKATTWPMDVAVQVDAKEGKIVAIQPGTLIRKPNEAAPKFVLK